jgi:general secretion pathway protein A
VEHLQHFGLSRDPFANEPQLESFLEIPPHNDALRRLDRGVRQSKGLCVLVGKVGAGKTMVVRKLLEELEEEIFEASMLVVPHGSVDSIWLLSRFARQLGVEEPAESRDLLMAQIYDHLAIVREDGRHAVLIVDDAHALTDPRVISEVCGLLKLEYEDKRLLTLVLAGEPCIRNLIDGDTGLANRIDVKVDLDGMDERSGIAYLTHRIQAAGGAVAIVDEAAAAALHQLGGGLPGRINTLADNALFEAFLQSRRQLTGSDVAYAARSLSWNDDSESDRPAAPLDATAFAATSATAAPMASAAAVSDLPTEYSTPIEVGGSAGVGDSIAPPISIASPSQISSPSPIQAPPQPPEPSLPGEAFDFGCADRPMTLDDLESELDAAFLTGPSGVPDEGPPKEPDDDIVDDLLIELIDE